MSPALPSGHRRTHPLTPLVTGWRIVVGAVAVLTAQNLAALVGDFTVRRLLIGLGVLAIAVVVGVVISALSWWATSYGVDAEGVVLRSGLLNRTRQFAPRARIESVSLERPLLARLLGLAKVRIEVAGGGDSYLDIAYVRSAEAEDLRRRILEVAAGTAPAAVVGPPADGGPADTTGPAVAATSGTAAVTGPADRPAEEPDLAARAREILHDGVTDGELIAEIPTERLVRSLLRDSSFLLGLAASVIGLGVTIALAIWQEGLSIAILVPLLPAVIAVPRYVFGRIESGWGFVSRVSDSGLRMRRGLANTRADTIAPGRIQRLELRRPLLWRAPRWTAVTVTVAGIDEDEDSGARSVLPVGTPDELASTIGHLAPPLGTDDDLAALEQLLTVPARELPGLRAPHPLQWYDRRTVVTVLLPGAVVRRSGLLARRVQIVPRDRVQEISVGDGPLARRLGTLDLSVAVAGHTVALDALPRADALALHAALALDAATARRYTDRDGWPVPPLAAAAPASRGTSEPAAATGAGEAR
ncbi:PH domain-containing protein [Brachybacterium rhamnosum]|uniref:PH domain-containing protein n=1 Tax=Brachybacterium rhamnosum TaxID=173361 RepID=A0ABW4PVR5_9MICO